MKGVRMEEFNPHAHAFFTYDFLNGGIIPAASHPLLPPSEWTALPPAVSR